MFSGGKGFGSFGGKDRKSKEEGKTSVTHLRYGIMLAHGRGDFFRQRNPNMVMTFAAKTKFQQTENSGMETKLDSESNLSNRGGIRRHRQRVHRAKS